MCKRETLSLNPLCEDIPISFVIIHERLKDVVVNRKSELYDLRINRLFVNYSQHILTPVTVKMECNTYHLRGCLR